MGSVDLVNWAEIRAAASPWLHVEENLRNLGLGSREVIALIHEQMDPIMWIELRASGFGERTA